MPSGLAQNPVSLAELLAHWHWTEDLFLSALGSALSIGGILWAAFKFFQEYRDSRYKELEQKKIEQEKKQEQLQKDREQREREESRRRAEFRWRQAEMAKTILDELFHDPMAKDAMLMLDWEVYHYNLYDNKEETRITDDDVLEALRINNTSFDDSESYIRECFDQFFEHLRRINHFIGIKLINFDDIERPLSYYIRKMSKDKKSKKTFFDFLENYEYEDVLTFIDGFFQRKSASA